jgi:transcription antitermination factor NusG
LPCNTIEITHPFETAREQLPWYAILTRTNAEKNVSLMLQAQGHQNYLPLYRMRSQWSDRKKEIDRPLFPGYVFCRLNLDRRQPVLMVPGVLSIVGFGSTFAEVPEDEILAVRSVISSGLAASPWPFLREGERVRILSGALEGVEGILLQNKSEYRVVVSIPLLQRSVAVEIEREWILPISTSRPC